MQILNISLTRGACTGFATLVSAIAVAAIVVLIILPANRAIETVLEYSDMLLTAARSPNGVSRLSSDVCKVRDGGSVRSLRAQLPRARHQCALGCARASDSSRTSVRVLASVASQGKSEPGDSWLGDSVGSGNGRDATAVAAPEASREGNESNSNDNKPGKPNAVLTKVLDGLEKTYPWWLDTFAAAWGSPIYGLFLYSLLAEGAEIGFAFPAVMGPGLVILLLQYWFYRFRTKRTALAAEMDDVSLKEKLSYRSFVRPQRKGWVGIHISLQLLVPAGLTQDPLMILLPSVQLVYMFLVRLPLWFSINRLRNVKENLLKFATIVLGPVAILLTVVFAIQSLEFAPSLLLNQFNIAWALLQGVDRSLIVDPSLDIAPSILTVVFSLLGLTVRTLLVWVFLIAPSLILFRSWIERVSESASSFQTRTVPSVTASIKQTNWKKTGINAAIAVVVVAVAIASRSDVSVFLAAVGYYMWNERAKAQKLLSESQRELEGEGIASGNTQTK